MPLLEARRCMDAPGSCGKAECATKFRHHRLRVTFVWLPCFGTSVAATACAKGPSAPSGPDVRPQRLRTSCLLWKGYNLNNVIRVGTQQMWSEGPGGTHYHVITGNYSEVGCGVYEGASGISVSQDFR